MKERIVKLQERLANEKGQLQRIRKKLAENEERVEFLGRRQEYALKVREILQLVAKKTQQKLEYHISGLVSTALAAVFEDPYEFGVEFVTRRGKTECDLLFRKGDNSCNPLDASGGGAMDVASFALRVAFLSMEKPRSRRILIADEPFKFLHGSDVQAKCGDLVKEVSDRLGLQIILSSQEEAIGGIADVVYEVSMSGGVSRVKRL